MTALTASETNGAEVLKDVKKEQVARSLSLSVGINPAVQPFSIGGG